MLGCQLPGSRASPPGPRGTTAQPQRGRPLVLQQRAEVVDGGRKCVPTCRLPRVSRCASMPPSPRGTAAQPRRTCPGSAAPVWVSPYTSRKKTASKYIVHTILSERVPQSQTADHVPSVSRPPPAAPSSPLLSANIVYTKEYCSRGGRHGTLPLCHLAGLQTTHYTVRQQRPQASVPRLRRPVASMSATVARTL